MDSDSPAGAKAPLPERADEAPSATHRRGPVDWDALERLRARLPARMRSAGEFIRWTRETERG